MRAKERRADHGCLPSHGDGGGGREGEGAVDDFIDGTHLDGITPNLFSSPRYRFNISLGAYKLLPCASCFTERRVAVRKNTRPSAMRLIVGSRAY